MKTLFKNQFRFFGNNYKSAGFAKISSNLFSNVNGKLPKTTFLFSIFFSLFSFLSFSQKIEIDTITTTTLKEIELSAVRAKDKTPITFINVTATDIAPKNLGQDITVLLNNLPSVVATTDAGNGVGYTSMRVRGSDGSRINVTLNGIPFNDSESQGTFFVNLPDFASSLESVQLQRGVGTSTNGAGAFGASLNMQMKGYQEVAHAELSNSYGSFQTRKHTFSFGSGLHNSLELNARISQVASDGYVDRATSNLLGYLFNINYVKKNSIIKFIAFGGSEKTYQAWNGLEDLDKLQNDRTYNSNGLHFDEFGNEKFYDNQVDRYVQNHFQLHWAKNYNSNWQSNIALHYTTGKGYFEQYNEDASFSDYNFPNFQNDTISDLVTKRWLDNDFFGATAGFNYKTNATELQFGGAINRYLGKHYGEVIWTQYYVPNANRYYDNFGNKDDMNIYGKLTQNLTGKLSVFADLQYRLVFYNATSYKFDPFNDAFRFFNPKGGFNYQFNAASAFYAYVGVANKEPRRDDYESGAIQSERLLDYELGWKFSNKKIKVNTNLFYMDYTNQLVLTGALNDVGAPVFTNSGKSYRLGLEVDAQIMLNDYLILQPNITLSQNKNKNFNFQRDGQLENLGNTNIAFSPTIVAANTLSVLPIKNARISVLSKFVGKQFMGNIDSDQSILKDYFINDLNITYQWKINKGIKTVEFSALINNILNRTYNSNGYFYTFDDDSNPPTVTTFEGAGYYPQAGINFLAGATIKF